MRGEGDLYDLVEDSIGEPLPLHVYNVDANQVREVRICHWRDLISRAGNRAFSLIQESRL